MEIFVPDNVFSLRSIYVIFIKKCKKSEISKEATI
jgi:hypothetical protein